MPRGARLFKLVVKRVRGSKKGTTYTRKFKTAAEMNAAKARYAKLGKAKPRTVSRGKDPVFFDKAGRLRKAGRGPKANIADYRAGVKNSEDSIRQIKEVMKTVGPGTKKRLAKDIAHHRAFIRKNKVQIKRLEAEKAARR